MNRTPDEIVDELLVLRSQDGDKAAWRQLVNRWQPRFYALARRLTSHHEGAADVTQETWIAILRAIHRLEDPARFRSWAHRIVANKSADWVRRRQRERKAINTAADGLQVDKGPHQNRNANEEEAITTLRRAINTLPREHRHLLTMFYVEKMPLMEIADVLSIPVGTVKSRLHSIRKELKMAFEEIQP
jgi:RNA polymerase sigma-70 factor (ECF subfamily)